MVRPMISIGPVARLTSIDVNRGTVIVPGVLNLYMAVVLVYGRRRNVTVRTVLIGVGTHRRSAWANLDLSERGGWRSRDCRNQNKFRETAVSSVFH